MIRVQDACGKTGKTIAVRLLPKTDLIEGIEEACKKNDVKYAYVSVITHQNLMCFIYI